MPGLGRSSTTLVCVLLLVDSVPAAAQTRPSLDLRTWHPSTSPEAGLVLEPVTTPGPWQWNVGAWLEYARSPVTLRDPSGAVSSRPVADRIGADLVAGIGLGDRAAVGIDLPIFLWQDSTGTLPAGAIDGGSLPTTGVGDLAVVGKATIVSNDNQGLHAGFGLAALARLTFPTGDRRSFASEGALGASASLLAEYAVGVGAVRASIGYHLRTEQRTWPDPVTGVTFGDEIPWSFGFTLEPKAILPGLDRDARQVWEVALQGWVPAGPVAPFGLNGAHSAELSPVLVALSDRIGLGHDRDFFVTVGAEVGLDHAFGVPAFRGVLSFGWSPRPHDRDADGVPDDVDECPDLPEDRDGIQDQDGCPEDDADGDGVPDAQDACPLAPGPTRSDPHTNGCPEPKR